MKKSDKLEVFALAKRENRLYRIFLGMSGIIIFCRLTTPKNFDADGVWAETIIPFSGITSVTFRNRYVSVWAKYLPERS